MAKRRTRKEKENALHTYLFQAPVNGQLKSTLKNSPIKDERVKRAIDLAQDASLASIKHDITRGLIIISFILALELVIYSVFK